jgi:hypothetical protein
MTTIYTPSFFGIDQLAPALLPGYTDGRAWNGWACPSFELEVGKQIAALPEWQLSYDADEDLFFQIVNEGDPRYEERHEFRPHMITLADGSTRKVYNIGDGWVWDEYKRPTPEALAAEFSRVMRDYLSVAELQTAVALNAAETNPGICHTHDFCDANMAMDAAWCHLTGEDGIDADREVDARLWNDAWALAKAAGFTLPAAT